MSKVQTTQAKLKGSSAPIQTGKIDYICNNLGEVKYFTILDIRSGYHHISIHPEFRPKMAFICPYGKFQGSE